MLEMNPQAGKGTDMVQANHIADPSDTNRGILWAGLDDDGAGLDISILLSEFGEWGGFFENDEMEFGEVSEIFLLFMSFPKFLQGATSAITVYSSLPN